MPHVYGNPPASPLRGRTIVVVRPAHQAAALRAQLEALGATVLVAPGIAIEPCTPDETSQAQLAALAQTDWLIFISANAVEHGLPLLRTQPGWSPRIRLAAIGNATAQALASAGCGPVLTPEGSEDSEGLLCALRRVNPPARRVLIVRGQGGREVLADAMRQAGAEVHYLEVYRRCVPAQDLRALRAALLRQAVDVFCALSLESIDGLRQQLGPELQDPLARALWLVSHPRVAAAACAAGLKAVATRGGASESHFLTELCVHLPRPDTDD